MKYALALCAILVSTGASAQQQHWHSDGSGGYTILPQDGGSLGHAIPDGSGGYFVQPPQPAPIIRDGQLVPIPPTQQPQPFWIPGGH